jgi:alkyl hydroperoxide reductase subunit D
VILRELIRLDLKLDPEQELVMADLETLRERIVDPMRDAKLNLQAVLAAGGVLDAVQRWGVAVASAGAARNPELLQAVLAAARAEATPEAVDDGIAAASLMAMNNVFYRFRHLVGKPVYAEKPARLRMTRIGRPATNKANFELFCLAVSAINGCEMCLRAHEEAVLSSGLTEDHVHDAVRIASTVQAAAVSLELSRALAPPEPTPAG